MSYDAVSLYKTAYEKMLNYKRNLIAQRQKYIEMGLSEYHDGCINTVDDCLELLKSTHMLLELDGDNE